MPENAAAATTLPATAAETSPDNPWPLQLLSQKLKMHIDRAPSAWVEGQVIELNRRGSNAYLTLRDIDAEISLPASVWTTVLDRQAAPLERGSRVVALIKAEFWLKTGRLNMSVKDIRPVGLGDLLARIERLRQALAAEGLFADSRKKRLPLLPHRIGLITGRDSDAKKDVLRNAALRWPAVEFEIREVAVQGNTAVAQMIAALRELDARPEVDVIVIARGGGRPRGPAAVQQRGAHPGRRGRVHARGERDRARSGPAHPGRRRRPQGLNAHGRREEDRSGRRRGARPGPAGAGPAPPRRHPARGTRGRPAGVPALPPRAALPRRHDQPAPRRRRTAQGPLALGDQRRRGAGRGPAGPPQGAGACALAAKDAGPRLRGGPARRRRQPPPRRTGTWCGTPSQAPAGTDLTVRVAGGRFTAQSTGGQEPAEE